MWDGVVAAWISSLTRLFPSQWTPEASLWLGSLPLITITSVKLQACQYDEAEVQDRETESLAYTPSSITWEVAQHLRLLDLSVVSQLLSYIPPLRILHCALFLGIEKWHGTSLPDGIRVVHFLPCSSNISVCTPHRSQQPLFRCRISSEQPITPNYATKFTPIFISNFNSVLQCYCNHFVIAACLMKNHK